MRDVQQPVVHYFLNDFDPQMKMHPLVRDWLNSSANMRLLSDCDNNFKGHTVKNIRDVLGKMKAAKKGFDCVSLGFTHVHLDFLGEQITQAQVLAWRVTNPRGGAPYATLTKMVRELQALYTVAQMQLLD
ncbi:hypothetical protein FOA52_009896 [Chlamydomonas sp. UWO 241]|nr:hypothetical protein FOA52_009896 [Chlamydomonas sp. UWO 241]